MIHKQNTAKTPAEKRIGIISCCGQEVNDLRTQDHVLLLPHWNYAQRVRTFA